MRTSPAETVVLMSVGAMFGSVSCLFARALGDERADIRVVLGLLAATFLTGAVFIAVAFAVVLE
jgi:heme/copper-type cytochrome/quinol oxidase subunit 3